MEAEMKAISQVLVLCLTIATAPAAPHLDLRKATLPAPVSRSHSHSSSRSGAIKGAIIGFPIGAFAGLTIGAESYLGQPRWHCAVAGGLTYSALGALIGWLH